MQKLIILYAKTNYFKGMQLRFDEEGIITDQPQRPYLAILTYGGKTELDFSYLVIPTYDMKDINCSFNIIHEYNVYENNKSIAIENKKKLKVKLKKEAINILESQ